MCDFGAFLKFVKLQIVGINCVLRFVECDFFIFWEKNALSWVNTSKELSLLFESKQIEQKIYELIERYIYDGYPLILDEIEKNAPSIEWFKKQKIDNQGIGRFDILNLESGDMKFIKQFNEQVHKQKESLNKDMNEKYVLIL